MIPGYRMVDLSLPLAEDLPCSWPGHVPYQHKGFNAFADYADPVGSDVRHGSFQTRWLMLAEHTGTHFDAPTHCVPPPDSGLPGAGPAGATSTDRVPLEQLTGAAVVIDVGENAASAEPGHSPQIGVDAIVAFEAEHGRIEPGEVVLLRTGWDRHYARGSEGGRYITDCVSGREPAWPAPTADAVSALVDRGTRCVGIDTPSVGAAEDGYPAHVAGLSHGLVYVEGLARLSELPPRGAIFVFLPLSIHGGTGAPGRAICLVAVD
jgi:kynurenine formamidase